MVVGGVIVAAALALLVGRSRSETVVRDSGRSPAQLTAHSAATMHFEYVISAGSDLRLFDRP